MRFVMALGVLSFILASVVQVRAQATLISPQKTVVVPSNPFSKYLTFAPSLAFQLLKAAPARGQKSSASLFRAFVSIPGRLQNSGSALLMTRPRLSPGFSGSDCGD